MGPFFRYAQGKLFRETKSELFNKLNKSNLTNLKLTKKQIVNQDLNRGILLRGGFENPAYPLWGGGDFSLPARSRFGEGRSPFGRGG